ncbi:MAG: hypothetical protein H0U29_03625 [Acidimicrobiia bacterium]|nr:hypothetical protein [Acidimicrobiia bacterium]
MPRRLVLLLLLVVAGCRGASDGGGAGSTTSEPQMAGTTTTLESTTTTSATSFEVPAVIDLPYVQRVLKTIYHLDGEATRHVYAKKIPDAELYERLEAIFGEPLLTQAKRILGEAAYDGFVRFADPPGDAFVRAVDILQATPTCMVILADLDYRPQYREARPPQPQAIIRLRRADVLPYNPTGWGVVAAGAPVNPNENQRICQ